MKGGELGRRNHARAPKERSCHLAAPTPGTGACQAGPRGGISERAHVQTREACETRRCSRCKAACFTHRIDVVPNEPNGPRADRKRRRVAPAESRSGFPERTETYMIWVELAALVGFERRSPNEPKAADHAE